MWSLHVLPALHGDALWLEYGNSSRKHSVLIDGGPRSKETTSLLERLLGGPAKLALIVVTHIDADHITGVLSMFENPRVVLNPEDVWFNGWPHLPSDLLGAPQGEALSTAILRRRMRWNSAFGGGPVAVPDEGPLPRIELSGGLVITLLSPTLRKLAELRPVWKREVEKAGLVPGMAAEEPHQEPDRLGEKDIDIERLADRPFEEDASAANGASIAMLAEFENRSLLLSGDAHAGVLTSQLRRLATERKVNRVAVDIFKVPHHGSRTTSAMSWSPPSNANDGSSPPTALYTDIPTRKR